jgi:hypothetical protein
MNTSYSLNSLSKEEIAIILEALLFSSSTDVCSSWYKEDSLKSFEVAKKIRQSFPEITLENVYLYEGNEIKFHDEHSEDILKIFPDIKKDIKEFEGLKVE